MLHLIFILSSFFPDFDTLLQKLSHDWLLLELKHGTSKSATNEFWSLGMEYFTKLAHARERENVGTKISQFRSIRDALYKEYVPTIFMEVAYEVRDTGDIIILEDLHSTPVKQFPPSKFRKLYETARVKVSFLLMIDACISLID